MIPLGNAQYGEAALEPIKPKTGRRGVPGLFVAASCDETPSAVRATQILSKSEHFLQMFV